MPIHQDWTNVWPSAHTFKWSAVPFPVRQGYVEVRAAFFPIELDVSCLFQQVYVVMLRWSRQLTARWKGAS